MQNKYYRLKEVLERTLDTLVSPFKEWEDIESLVTEAAIIVFGAKHGTGISENKHPDQDEVPILRP